LNEEKEAEIHQHPQGLLPSKKTVVYFFCGGLKVALFIDKFAELFYR
jgi:hypothetical protein